MHGTKKQRRKQVTLVAYLNQIIITVAIFVIVISVWDRMQTKQREKEYQKMYQEIYTEIYTNTFQEGINVGEEFHTVMELYEIEVISLEDMIYLKSLWIDLAKEPSTDKRENWIKEYKKRTHMKGFLDL